METEEAAAGEAAPAEEQESAETAPAAEPAPEHRKGRRRNRRRGRRRGKGMAQPPDAEIVSEAVTGQEETDIGAGGTLSEEAGTEAEAAGEMEAPGEEEMLGEEESEEAAGKGPRKVMLIDGMHPEEIRVAFVSDGNLDYFEVENQRRKQFKGKDRKSVV
jgi:hypothetical protein